MSILKNKKIFNIIKEMIFLTVIVGAIAIIPHYKDYKGVNILDSVLTLVFILIFVPLEILGYYKYRQIFNKKGIKTKYQTTSAEDSAEAIKFLSTKGKIAPEAKSEKRSDDDVFVDEINNNYGQAISTDILLKQKNVIVRYALNLFGDLALNLIFFAYSIFAFSVSALFIWGLYKLIKFL
jgi:hypothetical protein